MEIIKAIIFGIVEGITEWLPISSTGHMILLDEFINLNVSSEFYKLFEVVIQLGAILAVIIFYFKTFITKGIARVCISKFIYCTYVACNKFINRFLFFTLHYV